MSNNYSILLCNKGRNNPIIETKISNEDIDYIKSLKNSWFLWQGSKTARGGYIKGWVNQKNEFLHSIIMNRVEERPCNKYSVDHINRDKLDNRRENLRWATSSQQNTNKDKMKRRNNASPLPEGITENMLKKYVNYQKKCYYKNKNGSNNYWEGFIVIHPKLNKTWRSSYSKEIDIKEKLNSANKVVEDLEKDIYPKERKKNLHQNL